MRRTCFLAALATDDDEIGFRRMRQRLVEWQPEPLAAITGAPVRLHDAAQWPEDVAGPQLDLLDVDRAEYRLEANNAEHRRRLEQVRRAGAIRVVEIGRASCRERVCQYV